MPAQPAYITRNRHGTFYFRIVVPLPLRSALGFQREIRRSLKTDSQRLALRRARQFAARYEAAFDKVLTMVERDDYQITDEDIEAWAVEIERAGSSEPWGSWSSPSMEQPEQSDSPITDAERREDDEQQRRALIAKVLTGSSKRTIPNHQQELAEQLFDFGRSLPYRLFAKLLPERLKALALEQGRANTPQPVNTARPAETAGPTLYELWNLHRESEDKRGKPISKSAYVDERGHACRLNILSENRPVSALSLEDFNQLYMLVMQVKLSRGSKLPPPESPPEAILAGPNDERLGAATLKKIILRLDVLHKFAYKRGYTSVDPAKTDKPYIEEEDSVPQEEKAFTPDDLSAIFTGFLYSGTDSGSFDLVYPYQFWLPLLGLYTGGRLNEICQLDTEDVRQDRRTDIWMIDIADDPKDRPLPKALKNKSSRRHLPIHDELIRIGFLDFVEQARREGREKLFSDGLVYHDGKGWGSRATTFFTRMPSGSTKSGGYFHSVGIRKRLENGKTDSKKFHTFRHTFVDLVRNTSAEALSVLTALTGHSDPDRNESATYGTGFYMQNKHRILHSVDFPVDLSKVTYADFERRLGHIVAPCVKAHRAEFGLNQSERLPE